MLRTLTLAAVTATLAVAPLAPTASAQEINLKIKLDASKIVDTKSADKAMKSLERQAKKACSYDITSTKRKKTDWACVNEVVEQVVTHFDVTLLTSAYANSEMAVRVADAATEAGDALQ